MSECRRCSECQGQKHHWCTEILADDGERLQCKHCPATSAPCDTCMGDGCAECARTGVIDVQVCQDCLDATGGQCRAHQVTECTCYEIIGGHQPGCAFAR